MAITDISGFVTNGGWSKALVRYVDDVQIISHEAVDTQVAGVAPDRGIFEFAPRHLGSCSR